MAFGPGADSASHHLYGLFEKAREVSAAALAGIWLSISVLLGQDVISVYEPHHLMLPVRQSWSIASELVFYATVLVLFRHTTLPRGLAGFAALMAVK